MNISADLGASPAPKLTAGVTNVPLPFPKSFRRRKFFCEFKIFLTYDRILK
jgi:hypothetical protein